MQLQIVNSRSLMNFSLGILETLVKLVQVEILELITCSATGTGKLVKRALTSNETKVSSSGFIEEMFNFLDEIWTFFNKGWILITVILKKFSDEFGSVVLCCSRSWNYRVQRHVVCGFWEDNKILLLGSWSHEVLVGCILFKRWNCNSCSVAEFKWVHVDSWRCVFGDMLINWVVL